MILTVVWRRAGVGWGTALVATTDDYAEIDGKACNDAFGGFHQIYGIRHHARDMQVRRCSFGPCHRIVLIGIYKTTKHPMGPIRYTPYNVVYNSFHGALSLS